MHTRLEFWPTSEGEAIVLIETDAQGFSTVTQVGILWL